MKATYYRPNFEDHEGIFYDEIKNGTLVLVKNVDKYRKWDWALVAFRSPFGVCECKCEAHAVYFNGNNRASHDALYFRDNDLPNFKHVTRQSNDFECIGAREVGVVAYDERIDIHMSLMFYKMNNHDVSVFSDALNSVGLAWNITEQQLIDIKTGRVLSSAQKRVSHEYHHYRSEIKEVGNDTIIHQEYLGYKTVEQLEEFFGVHNDNVEWYRIYEVE